MKLLYRLLPFFILKQPFSLPLYFNALAPIFGFIYIFKYKKIYACYIPIFIMIICNVVVCIYTARISSIFRLLQLTLILFFSMYLIKVLKKYDIFLILKIMLIFIILVFILEVYMGNNAGYRDFFGFYLPRYRGVIGEFNFTALLLTGIGLLFATKKIYYYSAISFLFIIFTANRSFIISLFLFIFLSIISKINKRVSVYFGCLYILFIFLYPFLILGVDRILDIDNKILIDDFSSLRYQLHVAYANMGFDNYGFGIGYFNGKNLILDSEYLLHLNALERMNLILEQHNLFLQVFSEFGVIGYILFCAFIIYILRKAILTNHNLFIAFISLLTSCLFVNALHELIIYIYISFILKDYDK